MPPLPGAAQKQTFRQILQERLLVSDSQTLNFNLLYNNDDNAYCV